MKPTNKPIMDSLSPAQRRQVKEIATVMRCEPEALVSALAFGCLDMLSRMDEGVIEYVNDCLACCSGGEAVADFDVNTLRSRRWVKQRIALG